MESDEKDKVIDHLRFELNRHKDMLTEVMVMKRRWQKNRAEYGEKYMRLHNENQKLKATIMKLTGTMPSSDGPHEIPFSPKSQISRRRWKGREADSTNDELAA